MKSINTLYNVGLKQRLSCFRNNHLTTELVRYLFHILDCWDAWNGGHHKPGVYKIKPTESFQEFYAYCDKEGWLVFERRFDGEESFYR